MVEQSVLDPTGTVCAVPRKHGTRSRPRPGRPKVLIVDDDEDVRATVTLLLQGAEVRVLEATDAGTALAVAQSEALSAVVLDVMLPDRTGFEVCRLLRENPATSRLRIVMLTALTGLTEEVTAVLAGADAYMIKPIRRGELLAWLQGAI